MISIIKATSNHSKIIADIGNISVEEAHRGSCSANDLNQYLEKHYNTEAISAELSDVNNIYHIIYFDGEPAGFSKIILNAEHSNILHKNITKLDRIYLLSKFFDRKLGLELLNYNIALSKRNNQYGIWLFTWVGNTRAVNFYQKNGFVIIGSHNFQVTPTLYNLNHQMFLHFD
jgi:ribosomal protein S18 acetylase RimI-like enzyme